MAERKQQAAPMRERVWQGRRLRAAAGVLAFALMGTAVWLLSHLEPRLLPITLIEVEGELHHHSSRLLQQSLSQRLDGGLLTADLSALKSAAEELPWVGQASLRRVWPGTLRVRVAEHRPIARWNADGLVTAEGVVFHPSGGAFPAGLPLLEGDDKRAAEVTARYLKWREELMRVGHLIDALSVDPRGDWRIELVTGTELRLGTGPVEQRLARFIASAPQIEAAGKVEVVDLRYSNGFSVTWVPSAESKTRADGDRIARSGNRG